MATTPEDRVRAIRLAHRLLDGWEHFKSQRPEVLEALLETADDLDGKILAQSGQTHWEGCWKAHLECAVGRVAALGKALEQYADMTNWEHRAAYLWEWDGDGDGPGLAQRALKGE